MVEEIIDILWEAKQSGDEKEIKKAYDYLSCIGISHDRADYLLKERYPND